MECTKSRNQRSGQQALRRGRCSFFHHTYMITSVTHKRLPHFQEFMIGRFVVHEMKRLYEQGEVDSLAWVVMPDHIHWLFVLREKKLPEVVKRLKARSAIKINRYLRRTGAIWQPAYYDHAIRRDEDIQKLARYIIANPLRAGLVEDIGAYPLWDAVWL